MKLLKLISFLLFAFFLFPIGAEKGEELVQENCLSCHGNPDLNLMSLSTMSYISKNEMLQILSEGKMKTQAENLTNQEKEEIAIFLTKGEAEQDSSPTVYCSKELGADGLKDGSLWSSWGQDSFNKRHQTSTTINSRNITNLKLKWSFGLRTENPRGQPIAVGSVIFISAGDTTYALDKNLGCAYWTFTSAARLRNAPAFDTNTKDAIYLIDQDFGTYKINAISGQLIWKVNIPKETQWSTSSASPILVGSKLVVPLSTIETVAPINPKHECCTSSGGIALLDAETGNIIWNHRVLEEAKYVGKVFVTRTKKFAPAGAAVWNAPGVDLVNKRIFFGTGQSTQSPASEFSDAIITLDLETGKRIWSTQTLSGDAHNVACEIPVVKRLSCPDEDGPDFDFGASVIQSKTSNGESILLAGQKSGWVFGLNNDSQTIEMESEIIISTPMPVWNNTTLLAQWDGADDPLVGASKYNDIWGYTDPNGTEFSLIGQWNGTSIIDISTDPEHPLFVEFIPGSYSSHRDIKSYGEYVYIGTEANRSDPYSEDFNIIEQGVQVVDMTDPTNPQLVNEWDGVIQSHNIMSEDDAYLYVIGANTDDDAWGAADLIILDLSDPANPEKVGEWNGEYLHDVCLDGDILYGMGIYTDSIHAIDISIICLSTLLTIYLFFLTPIFNAFFSSNEIIKFIISVLLIAPYAFFMGMPFPLGLAWLEKHFKEGIPWAWGINGCASVIGAVFASLLLMSLEYTTVTGIAVFMYLATLTIFRFVFLKKS